MTVARTRWQQIAVEVAEKHSVPVADLRGYGKLRPLVGARAELAWRMQQELALSPFRIGQLLHRDRTTIIHLLGRHAFLNGLPGHPAHVRRYLRNRHVNNSH